MEEVKGSQGKSKTRMILLTYYYFRDTKGSIITASRTTDLKEVTRNCSHFKELRSLPDHARAESQHTPQQ